MTAPCFVSKVPHGWRVQLALLLLFFSYPSLILAQSDTATISGRITDQGGQVLTDARVSLTNIDTNLDTAIQSNAEGIYVLATVRPGRYRLTVEREGFRSITLDDLTLSVQDVLGRNFTMQLSPVTDSVTVTAGREERNLSPAVSTVVNRQFVDNMPLNGRSFQSLIQLTPGALVVPAGQGLEGQFSVNGQRTNSNYFTVDGVSVNFGTNISVNPGQNLGGSLPALTIGGGTNSFVSVDAMQEFRTQTSTYAAEFGRSSGAQIAIVTRSGTSQFHGTAFDYVRNEAFDARNWFNRAPEPKPPLRQQDFGGTLGGPLPGDRSFFFLSYEGLRLRQPQTITGYFYTPETRAVAAPVYQAIVNALPIPNGPLQNPACNNVTTPCLASLTASYANVTSFDASSLRLDHSISERFTLFARANHTPSTAMLRSFAGIETSSRNTDLVTGGMTAILSESLLSDLRIGWSRSSGQVETNRDDAYGAVPPAVSSLFPAGRTPAQSQASVTLPGGNSVGMGTRASNAAEQLNVVDTVSMNRGTHQFRFGVDYRYFQPTGGGTRTQFVQVNTFDQLKSGTMGVIGTSASEVMTLRMHNWSLFGQDTWQAGRRLTLTYGLRWEANTPPVSVTSGKPLYAIEGVFDTKPLGLAPAGTPLWRTRYNNFAQRVGAAYQIQPSTIVRGGFGLFHDLGYGALLGNLIFGFPYNRLITRSVAGQPFELTNPAFDPLPISTNLTSLTAGTLAAFDPDLQLPVTMEWNTAIQRELGTNQSLSLTYIGSSGHGLLRPDYVVPSTAGSVPIRVSATRNAGHSRYDALQAQYQRRLSRGLQALASYTLASARDLESDDLGGNFFGAAWNANSATSLSRIQLPPMSPSDFDIRHAFSAAVSYELPAPIPGAFARAVIGSWGVDAIVRASSAPPLNVRIEGVSPELGPYKTQPDRVPGQTIWLSAPEEPGERILNPDAFTLPPAGLAGNLPRNSIRSPFHINQTDLALRRRFPLPSGTSLEFRAEFFNLFNNPMFGGSSSPVTVWGRCTQTPCTGQQSATFGKVGEGATLNEGLGGDPLSGGQSAIYAIGGPRSIQFSLKLRF